MALDSGDWLTPEEAQDIEQESQEIDVGGLPRTEQERQLFRILRLRGNAEDELERAKRESAAWIQRLENRVKSIDYVLGPVATMICHSMLAGKKVKSIRTPFGKAGFRSIPERLEVQDEKAVVAAWVEGKLPAEVVKTEQVNKVVKRELDAMFASGEVPPGCGVVPASEKFYMA